MSEAAKVEKKDFLVELGTEELPPKALRELELAFLSGVQKGLTDAGLSHGEIQSFATPRRLAVLVKRLATRQPDQDVKRRGPPVGASFDANGQPTRAASAFAESCGVSIDALQRLDEGKGQFLFFIGKKAGTLTAELLPKIVQASLDALPIPKRMRWGAGTAEFVRPVHWLVMIHGADVDPGNGARCAGRQSHARSPVYGAEGDQSHQPRPATRRRCTSRGKVVPVFRGTSRAHLERPSRRRPPSWAARPSRTTPCWMK